MKKISKLWAGIAAGVIALFVLFLVLTVHSGDLKSRQDAFPFDIAGQQVSKIYSQSDSYFVGTEDGHLYCFDATGEKLWEAYNENAQVVDIKLHGGDVYIATAGNSEKRKIRAYDAMTGDLRKVYRLPRSPVSFEMNENSPVFAVYAKIDQKISMYVLSTEAEYTPGSEIRTSAKNTLSSDKTWASIPSDVLVTDEGDVLYTTTKGTIDRTFYDDGNQLNAGEVYSGNFLLSLSVYGKGYASLDRDGTLYHLSSDFGEMNQVSSVGKPITSISRDGDLFYAKIKNGGIACMDADGEKLFRLPTHRDAALIYASQDSFAYKVSSASGSEVTYYTLDTAIAADRNGPLFVLFLVLTIVFFLGACYATVSVFPAAGAALNRGFARFGRALWKHKFVYVGLIPTFVLLIVFYYYPIVWGFGLSMFDYLPGEHAIFVGFNNFRMVLRNAAFWSATGNMFILLATDLIKALVPPFLFAECILALKNKQFSFWVRALMFIPGILPGVASTLVWAEGIFGSTNLGLINSIGKWILPSYVSIGWLHQPQTALMSLVLFGFPWVGAYLIFYGALMGIPSSMYEAAKLDGCGWVKRIIRLDIPMILPQIKYIFITSFIASVQDYARIWVTTKGTNSTATPAVLMYQELVGSNPQYGFASAMSVFLFLFLLVATILNFRMQSDQS